MQNLLTTLAVALALTGASMAVIYATAYRTKPICPMYSEAVFTGEGWYCTVAAVRR